LVRKEIWGGELVTKRVALLAVNATEVGAADLSFPELGLNRPREFCFRQGRATSENRVERVTDRLSPGFILRAKRDVALIRQVDDEIVGSFVEASERVDDSLRLRGVAVTTANGDK
jgi:hypothetical protein